jgi:uncharacterized membrane protein YfcA
MGTYVAYLAAGLAAGFTSALLGIGGGVVMVPILVLLFGLEARTATATSLAYIVPIAAAGVLLALWHGDAPRWRLVLMAAPMGLAGAYAGRWASSHLSGAHIKLLFAVLMIVVGVRLGLNGLQSLKAPPAKPPAAAPAEPLSGA